MSVSRGVAALFSGAPLPAYAPPRSQPLGMAGRRDQYHAAELALRARVLAAGPAGYRLAAGDVGEILAAYDLHRRGELEPTDTPWTYRAPR